MVYGGYLDSTTNNRTEMLAIINAIKTICETGTTVNIISDSGYVVKGYTDPAYLDKWVANGWKTSNKKPVMNQDLWEEMLKLGWSNAFYFTHIRGHKKDKNHLHAYWNDIVDKCCTYLMKECKQDGKMFKMVYNLKTESIVRVEEYKNERCK